MTRTSLKRRSASLDELDAANESMSAALNDYFSGGLEVEAIEQWTEEGNARTRRNRKQFVGIFPSLAPMLALRPSEQCSVQLCCAVDCGEDLVKAIADAFNVSPSTVRHLRGVSWSVAMADRQGGEMDLLGGIDSIPHEMRPRIKDEWETFWILVDSLRFERTGPISHVLSDLCRHGYDDAFELAMDVTNDAPFRLSELHDYFGFVQRWADTFLGGKGYSARDCEKSVTAFLSRYKFLALWRQCERWHDAMLDPAVTSALSHNELRWPPLLPLEFHSHGLTVTSLCSANDLRAEGRALEHCVATYSRKCIAGGAHILSIRTSTGERISTVELSLNEGRNGIVFPAVMQHRGYRNGICPEDAQMALADLLSYWRTPQGQAWLKHSLVASHSAAAKIDSFDREQHSQIPWESFVKVIEHTFSDYSACAKTLGQIAARVGTGMRGIR